MAGIKDFSTTAANNTTVGSVSVAEGMLPSTINNAFRGLAAEIREWYNDSQWVIYGDGDGSFTITYASATSFTVSGVDVTSFYHVGRRVKAIATTPGTIFGTISATTFSTNTTVTVTWDSGSLANEAVSIYVGALSKTNDSIPELVITNAKISASAAIDATKIGGGAVSNTEFSYLDGVTSAIQTQIDAKQTTDAELTAIAGLTSAADKGIQFTGSGTAAVFDLTTAGKALLDDASASAQRTTLGLGTIATQDSSNVSLTGGSITGLGSPSSGSDAATKTYVDNLITGLKTRIICRAASTADVTIASALENGDTLDGVTLVTGDRVLLKNQSTDSQNGIYTVVASGSASRDTEFDTITELAGQLVIIQEGTVNADTFHLCTTDTSATLGSSSISFTKVTPSNSGTVTSIVAGTGLTGGTITSSGTLAIDTGVVTTLTGTQTLTNKTLTTPIISSISNTGTVTLPTATDTLVGRATTDTLTNKTLTLPTIDNIKIGYSTTATAAGTTTLTVSSNYKQYFTGSTTQTIVLPVVSTLTLGHTFEIHNNSSGLLTVNSSGSNLVGTINANTTAICTCILTTGTTAASWDFDLTGFTTALPVTRGGTGLTALGTSLQSLRVNSGATALEFATASAGFSGANVNSISSSSITLTSASSQFQVAQIDSSTNNFVTLPDATTMSTEGSFVFVIENRSPVGGSIDIKNNSGTILFKLSANNVAFISLVDNSTSAGVFKIIEKNLQALVTIDTTNATTTSFTNATRQRILPLSSTKFVLFHFHASGDTGTVYTKVGDISGSSITFGSEQSTTIVTSGHTQYVSSKFATIRLSDSSFLLHLGYTSVTGGGSGTAKNRLRACTVSGTTVTFGAETDPSFPETVTADFTSMYFATGNGNICRMADNKFAIIYNTAHDNTQWSGSLACKICTVSGTTITQGTAVNLGSSTFTFPSTVVCHDTDRLCVIYAQASTGVTTGRNKVNIISVSSTTPTWGTSLTVEASDVVVTGWAYTGDPFTQDTNSMYGVALSTTSVFGGVFGSHILISISGTTPTVTLKKAYSANPQGYVPPLKIDSSTVFIYDYYYYITSTGFYPSPAIVGTSNSTLLTFYSHKTSTEDTGILNFTFAITTATISQGTLNP
jgi:hypothetical protein